MVRDSFTVPGWGQGVDLGHEAGMVTPARAGLARVGGVKRTAQKMCAVGGSTAALETYTPSSARTVAAACDADATRSSGIAVEMATGPGRETFLTASRPGAESPVHALR